MEKIKETLKYIDWPYEVVIPAISGVIGAFIGVLIAKLIGLL